VQVISAAEAERIVAGCVLRDPDVIPDALELVRPDHFLEHPCRVVYQAALDLRDAGEPVSANTVFIHLKARGMVDELGPAPHLYLADLLDLAPTAAHLWYYAGKVKDAYMRRQACATFAVGIRDAADPTGPAEEIIERSTKQLAELLDANAPAVGPRAVAELFPESVRRYAELAAGGGPQPITTGFPELDGVMCGGFRPEEFILLAARTSVGKPALALPFLVAGAAAGHPALLFTLEMTDAEVMDRLIAAAANVPHSTLRGKRRMSEAEESAIRNLARHGSLARLPLYVDGRKRMTVAQVSATARRYVRRHGVKLVVIDYLQLIQPENRKANRYEQVGQISRDLKVLAGELGVALIALAQVNRDAAGQRPELHHLRESGSLEQDANTVLLLHREADPDPRVPEQEYELIVAKQRSGPCPVTVRLTYAKRYTRFQPAGIPL
jgi:replicative DNA helicase